MSGRATRAGELYARNKTTLLDTRVMGWDDDPELGRVKVLARFATGERFLAETSGRRMKGPPYGSHDSGSLAYGWQMQSGL